jgi:hypothetical protein
MKKNKKLKVGWLTPEVENSYSNIFLNLIFKKIYIHEIFSFYA